MINFITYQILDVTTRKVIDQSHLDCIIP